MKSKELMMAFLAGYTPDLPKEMVAKVQEADRLGEEAAGLERQLDLLRQKIEILSAEKRAILDQAREIRPKIGYSDGLKLDPNLIYFEMKQSVARSVAILGRSLRADLHSLSITIELLKGERHAISFIGAWEPIGEENGDAVYRALLEEAGFTLEAAESKYAELKKLPDASRKKS